MNIIEARKDVKAFRKWRNAHFHVQQLEIGIRYLRCKYCNNGFEPDTSLADILAHVKWCPKWPKNR